MNPRNKVLLGLLAFWLIVGLWFSEVAFGSGKVRYGQKLYVAHGYIVDSITFDTTKAEFITDIGGALFKSNGTGIYVSRTEPYNDSGLNITRTITCADSCHKIGDKTNVIRY